MAYIASLVTVPEPVSFKMPLRITKGPDAGNHMMDQFYNMPHSWFSYLHTYFPTEFCERFVGAPGSIRKFWMSVRPDDPRRKGELFSRADLYDRAIPIAIYGDG
eukprot:8476976-Pyramimonas_sp.AAC.1